MTVDGDVEALVSAVEGLRDAVEGARLPLDVTSRAPAEASRRQLLQQLDDYVLPRLRAIDAPLLAVVGGSTGADSPARTGGAADDREQRGVDGAQAGQHVVVELLQQLLSRGLGRGTTGDVER